VQLSVHHCLDYWIDSRKSQSWSVREFENGLGSIGSILGGISSFLGCTPEQNVYYEQAKRTGCDGYCSSFFPKWSVIFAPLGLVLLGWGWWNLRDNRRPYFSLSVFWSGCILWMYGLADILIWSWST